MHGDHWPFYGLVRTKLVRSGSDVILGRGAHVLPHVYLEMMLSVARLYNSAPNVLDLPISTIRLFYNGIRSELKKGHNV